MPRDLRRRSCLPLSLADRGGRKEAAKKANEREFSPWRWSLEVCLRGGGMGIDGKVLTG